jgi:hypothetical protein
MAAEGQEANQIHNIPYDQIVKGDQMLQVGYPPEEGVGIAPLLNRLEQKYIFPNEGDSNRKMFQSIARDVLLDVTVGDLDRLLPFNLQEDVLPDKFYQDMGATLRTALHLARERLATVKKEFDWHPDINQQIPLPVQASIAEVRRYAWYITIVNHRDILAIAMKNGNWQNWGDAEQTEYYTDCLYNAYKLISDNYDATRGEVTTFLHLYLRKKVSRMEHSEKGLHFADSRYVRLYFRADGMLSQQSEIPDNPANQLLLCNFLYDQETGAIKIVGDIYQAFAEYTDIYNNWRGQPAQLQALEWKKGRPRGLHGRVVKRSQIIQQNVAIYTAESWDDPKLMHIEDPSSGEVVQLEVDRHEYSGAATTRLDREAVLEKFRKDITSLFPHLSPQERAVITYRYGMVDGKSHSIGEVGRQLGIPGNEVRNIEQKAMRKFRNPQVSRRVLKDDLNLYLQS